MIRPIPQGLCVAGLCLSLVASARGQDAAGSDDVAAIASPIAVVTVAAARGERIDMQLPSSVTVLDEDEIRLRRPAQSFPDLVHRIPGVHGQQTGPAQGSPLIRGLTGYHVLTLIDGIRLNGSFFRSGPNQYNGLIDPLTIRDVEAVRGPASVLYGSDALGGVLSVRTRLPEPPQGLEDGEAWVRPGAYFRLAQPLRQGAESTTHPRIELMGGKGPVSALLGFDYQSVGDREGGQHQKTLRNTQYTQVNGDAKILYRLSEQEQLTVAFQRVEQRNAPRTHSTTFSESYRGTSVGSDLRRDLDQSRQLIYAQLESRDRGPFDRLKSSLSLQRNYENQHRRRSNGAETRTGFEVWSLGAFVEAESDLPLPLDPTLAYGFDYYHDFVDSFETDDGTRRPRGPIADDADYDLFGAYLRLELHVERWLDVYAGVRYSLAHVIARDVDPDPTDGFAFGRLEETYDAVVGSGGFVFHVVDELALVGSINQGFRAPNLDDTTSFRAVSSNGFDSPSPDLDPERSVTLEAGLKWELDWLQGQAFYAYTFLRDFIQRVPTGNQVNGLDEFTKANVSDGAIEAIDGQARLVFAPLFQRLNLDVPDLGLSFLARFSWVRGRADALINGVVRTDHLRRAPPARFGAILHWEEPETQWLWAEVEGEFFHHQSRLSVGDLADTQRIPPGGTPGYALWHVRVGVNLFEDRIRGSIGLENIFDVDHRPHGSGTNGYGRTLVLGLQGLW